MMTTLNNYHYPTFDKNLYDLEKLPDILPYTLIIKHGILPLLIFENILHVAIIDPHDSIAMQILQTHTQMKLHLLIISEAEFNELITLYCKQQIRLEIPDLALSLNIPKNQTALLTQDEPLSEFLQGLLDYAIEQGASDLHLESYENYSRLRLRQDGILRQIMNIQKNLADRLATRLKVLAHLDIAQHRLPQDGHFKVMKANHSSIDLRISTCPVLHGEKVVLRILDKNKILFELDELGFDSQLLNRLKQKLNSPQGLILVSGPTGCGKTVTLYSALRYLNCEEKNISSVENPVEIELEGINQINIHTHLGLTFAKALKTLLRQDPDVIMIGEIRDEDTAKIAMQAALTGHLVLATIHTNSAAETLKRLKSFGINTDDFPKDLALILSQRLIRKLCQHCKALKMQRHACHHCINGYAGRTAIYEAFNFDTTNLGNSLRECGMQHVKSGLTSLDEIHRVLGE